MSATENVVKQCTALANQLSVIYTLRDKDITYEEVFKPGGLLPAISKRADQLCSLIFGYGIGVTFSPNESSQLGNEVEFDSLTPDIIRLPCFADVIIGLSKGAKEGEKVSLDELLYD